jgi:hypothetical protein
VHRLPGGSPKTPAWHIDAARGPSTPSFDHLVGERKQIIGDFQAECFGSPKIDYKLEFRRLQNRQLGRLGPLENSGGVDTVVPVGVGDAYPIAEQSAGYGIFAELIDGRQALAFREANDLLTPRVEIRVRADEQRADAFRNQRGERAFTPSRRCSA